ncbi:murein DD-endopeptidase MepM/ murein hydrolase activator NlpD [Mycetocola sp. CAN_C7]|uniref:M23 family metallopeptidase n=1 Tax=Mycetocola sp. CAN_C7 TaxID=2787724 RepID=UPI0018CA9AEA
MANDGAPQSRDGQLTRRDRQRTIREETRETTELPSRRSLRQRAAESVVDDAPVAAEPTPLRRRRDARAAIQAERPTTPEDVSVVEETITLSPVWADQDVDGSAAFDLTELVPRNDADFTEMPVPATAPEPTPIAEDSVDAFVPLEAHHSSIAAAFIAPPTAPHRPLSINLPVDDAAPVRARDTDNQGVPRTGRRRSFRSPAIVALAIPALLGTVALPAYAFSPGSGTAAIADANAALTTDAPATQSLTVSDDVTLSEMARDSYSATSEAELEASYASSSYIYDSAAALAAYLAPSSTGWWRPLPGEITSKYGPRGLICNGAGCSSSFHEGMDFGGACGTPIKAAAAGTVSFTGNAGAFGNRVIIDHGDGLQTIYGHLLGGSYKVAVGDVVEGGMVIAEVGATGVVSGCHLDLKVAIDGEHTNPAPFLREHGVVV